MKFRNNNKSQFFILSGVLLFLLLIFIYSLETDNSYITKFSKNTILDNVVYETCQVGYHSNGSQIDNRYKAYISNVSNYCNSYENTCELIIINNTQIPPEGNWSKLNYTHYDYSLNYSWNGLNTSLDFSC